jgi:hypothetical protein
MSKFDYIIEQKKRSNFNNLSRIEKSMARKHKKYTLSMKLFMLSIFILSLLLLKCL